ncbi:3-methyl-2-oxobutanoate hydroxymethyltransferase [Jiangella ureilytica]|uniref:3-methyl-2-oxobutanoate hydroxymethyltransferase n=1 Tax=Jiangella ureilytica TaxID=2530374 RepID=A0A4R4RN32_9ACTN|nr:3-methyl-2-oxobutanoate hydroxymethyltransferase [Jiangella ureilytica]TDC51201.1 3-methyl-2-oxobutanoate hydroxymethyltransferase [Jiangella ureilytica]
MTHETVPLYGGKLSRRVTIRDLRTAKERGERWPMLTSYDMYTAEIFDAAGIPVLLVGDSAGNNVYAHADTVPVTVEELVPLARAVVRSTSRALVVCDLPFGSYQLGPEQALATSIRIMKETGAQAVKLEGGLPVVESVHRIVEAGVPVMAHIGFTPQSVNALGGYRVQGRGTDGDRLVEAALALEEAGAFAVVLEMVTAEVAAEVTKRLHIPTVGIGAGPDVDAQVLVWQDMAGMREDRMPRFVKQYGDVRGALLTATRAFADDVVSGTFPAEEHTYH